MWALTTLGSVGAPRLERTQSGRNWSSSLAWQQKTRRVITSCLYHLWAGQPQAGYLVSLCLSCFICEMMRILTSQAYCKGWMNVKPLKKYLAHTAAYEQQLSLLLSSLLLQNALDWESVNLSFRPRTAINAHSGLGTLWTSVLPFV